MRKNYPENSRTQPKNPVPEAPLLGGSQAVQDRPAGARGRGKEPGRVAGEGRRYEIALARLADGGVEPLDAPDGAGDGQARARRPVGRARFTASTYRSVVTLGSLKEPRMVGLPEAALT